MRHTTVAAAAVGAVLCSIAVPALASKINTGGAQGAYHTRFCTPLQQALAKAQLNYECTTSEGTRENVQRVMADPRQIGFAQLDIFALENRTLPGKDNLSIMRVDDVRECLFLVTRNKQFTHYGDVSAYAGKLRFVLPPKKSGSTGTFEFLQQIDKEGLGQAASVTYASTTEDAIKQALSADDTMALFVQFPDPASSNFKLVNELGGQMIPVIDRNILRQQIDDRKIYFAVETEVAQARWVKSGKKVVTACTPMAIFTGNPSRVDGDKAKQDQADLIRTVQNLKSEELLPKQSPIAVLLKRTKELSGQSVEKLVTLSEKAREQSKPALEKAKEISEKAAEAAKPYIDKAKEATQQAIDKAKEAMGGAGGGSGPTPAPKPEATPAPKQ